VSNGEAPGRSEGTLRESEDLFRATFERVGVVSKCSRISIRRPPAVRLFGLSKPICESRRADSNR
jgi:hypothetical protein